MATLTKAAANVDEYGGPSRLLRVDGRVVVTIRWVEGDPDYVPSQWYATALGWGHDLLGASLSKESLISYCGKRFPDCRIDEE